MNFIESIYVSTSEFQRDLVRQIDEKRLRIQDRKTGKISAWSLEEIDAYCVFDDKRLARCQTFVSDPSKLTSQHLSCLAPLISFEFTAVHRFLENKDNLRAAFESFLDQTPSWQAAVQAHVVSECLKNLNR